jgi:hypothetical protein
MAGLAFASQSLAGTLYYNGVLSASSPTWVNPGGDGGGSHYYNVTNFTVDTAGTYTFEMASPNSTAGGSPSNAVDTNMRLYSGASFNPVTPGSALNFNDDFTGSLTVLPGPYIPTITATSTGFTGAQPGSRFTFALTAGTNYFLVTGSYRNTTYVVSTNEGGATGPYYTGIGGPGNITVAPAPASLALLGLGGLVASRRRRA